MTLDEALIGKTIVAYDLSVDKESLILRCSDETNVVLVTTAECCSRTWIEGIDDTTPFEGGTITAVENVEMDDRLYQVAKRLGVELEEAECFYGLKITTTRGRVVIDYRNSNGYYGGSIEVQG